VQDVSGGSWAGRQTNVSFTAAAGEIVVLALGRRAAAKTTDLALRCRPEHPTSGRGTHRRHDGVGRPARGVLMPRGCRNIGMVFQSYAVWPHMTVAQTSPIRWRARGMGRAEIDRQGGRMHWSWSASAKYAQRPATRRYPVARLQRVALAAQASFYSPQLLPAPTNADNLDASFAAAAARPISGGSSSGTGHHGALCDA